MDRIVRKLEIFAAIMMLGVLFVTTQANATSTADKLNRVKQQKKNNESKLDSTTNAIEELKLEKAGLGDYLDNLALQLEERTQELERLEGLMAEKEAAIEEAQEDLKEARISEKEQYDAMRSRIRFMYERSQNLYLELLFSADSFANFLNQSQYIEKMTEYDRNMLVTFRELQKRIESDEEILEGELEHLEQLQSEASEKKDEIALLVKETQSSVEEYMYEISEKEQEALLLEEEIRRQEVEAADLQERLASEIALSRMAATSETRDLSGLSFDASDLDMMAAIIECEAGGEPYTGKVAVGAVVLNRVRSSLFPDTVAGVIYQNRQFSPVGSGRFAMVLARGANTSCYEAAQDAMSGSSPVGNCVFFRTPIPGLTGIQIGGHIFY
ncbi:MAG: cell wall hydrolase [Lachnospiraceae bacterium]|nr:cell wall hydrolase [Lachnospiraceae bacterium]